MKAKLAFKFAAFTAGILAVSFLALGIFFVHKQRTVIFHDLQQLSTALATNLAANSAFGLITRNRNQLQGLLKSLANVRDIKFSWIEDRSGDLLASFGNIPFELFQKIHLQIHSHRGGVTDSGINVQDLVRSDKKAVILLPEKFPNLLIASAPVIETEPVSKEALILDSHGEKGRKVLLGTVVVGMSLNRMDRNILSAKRQSLAITSVVALISLILTFSVVHMITRPLFRLKAAAEQVMAGITPRLVTVKSKDEIRDLAEAFNQMVSQLISGRDALEKAYRELETVNTSLEEKVAQRTEVLQNTVAEYHIHNFTRFFIGNGTFLQD